VVVVVGEKSPHKKTEPQEDITSRNLEKEGTVIHLWAILDKQP
jgi:hypothetical protein